MTEETYRDNQPTCVYNKHILCGLGQSEEKKHKYCSGCGWNPEEERRRKNVVKIMQDKGLWKPGFYDPDVLRTMPTADIKVITFCKDCLHYVENNNWCHMLGRYVGGPEFYCADGEKREDG